MLTIEINNYIFCLLNGQGVFIFSSQNNCKLTHVNEYVK